MIVRVEVPVLFATEIPPSEQVADGLAAGEMLQLSTTVDGSSPPTGLIAMVEVADAPGITESDGAEGERLKSGAVTTRLTPVDVLALKFVSPA